MIKWLLSFGTSLGLVMGGCSAAQPAPDRSNFAADGPPRIAAPSPATGFYLTTKVIEDASQLPSAAGYSVPGIEGVFLRISWAAIQPASDRYDWRLFDAVVRKAQANRKKISIGIVTGSRSPTWLSDVGVPFQAFSSGKQCDTDRVPAAWTPAFTARYVDMMKAVKKRLVTLGAFDDVTMVKVSGLTQKTLELRLPRNNRCSRDTDSQMSAFGFRPAKTLAAWTAMADGIASAFPKQLIVQPILQAQGFPAIDDNGRPIAKGAVDLGTRIVNQCITRYKGRCGIQWTALKFQGPMAQRVLNARDRGAVIGWQTNLYEGPRVGAGCQADRRAEAVPCTATTYQALLKRGIDLGATFIEVWEPDALRYPTAFTQAGQTWKL